ncbi:uncharacterized protein LOC131997699 [Stomoxys calcitrans]|uniref:uncharacterized protein LOC131994132 n=2 Tax=Stomoxys calcitrans TaxID=35570 RepID=UPI0027E29282|nr:uncharacterized protein LOC131994132 [Stomoxys calcitrans]XP_059216460.1 uncharacterized protein LOC131994132 [Stomoxys calcitrans]XP_059216531.1 uncharacterized protein LOC131994150 [Stomoxys calcitrans]XP_059216743.1 uncharacterized protein LOC131994218 [Stomoxys calcitrans]XP_059216744.1 uncharacterized protein LOC131994218 [Stomoxys calcitrans]XP_059219321.1 uncharacterized protein LOC131995176 [Stomoxys calcitrans]XP_059219322.1 uncharacterized protein LOC131995176 [Stomoxys calcitran
MSQKHSQAKCRVCSSQHHLRLCPDFNRMSVAARWEAVKSRGYCFNCLCLSHTREWCRSRNKCEVCNKAHHTKLHTDKIQQQSEENRSKNLSNPVTQCKNSMSKKEQGTRKPVQERLGKKLPTNVFMPTALAKIITTEGPQKARLLISSGQVQTLIAKSLVHRLSLPTTIADDKEFCIVYLLSYHDHTTKLQVRGLVKNHLSITMPPTSSDKKFQSIYGHIIDLADPHFYNPKDVEIIIGSDLVASVLRAGLIQTSKNMPVLQSTIFGWVVSGACTL